VDSTRHVLEGAGHGELSAHPEPWNSAEIMDRVVDFLRTHLTAKTAETRGARE